MWEETSAELTFLPKPLQPHCQFLSMFRYQFRGPLGGADEGIKRGKLLVDACAADPTSNPLSIEPVFPGRAKAPAGGRGQSPGFTARCPACLPGFIEHGRVQAQCGAEGWCSLKWASGDTQKSALQDSPFSPGTVSEEGGELGLVPLPARATPLSQGAHRKGPPGGASS